MIIHTAEERAKLKPGTIARDGDGNAWLKGTGSWVSTGGDTPALFDIDDIVLMVVWQPNVYDEPEYCPYDCDSCHDEDCPCDRLGCAGNPLTGRKYITCPSICAEQMHPGMEHEEWEKVRPPGPVYPPIPKGQQPYG